MKRRLLFGLMVLLVTLNADNIHAHVVDSIYSFWKTTKSKLAKIPIEASVEPIKDALPYRCYKVILTGLEGVKFVSYLAIPVQGEKVRTAPWPVVITTPGYGGFQQGVMLSECQRGYAIIQVFTRGQGPSAEFFKIEKDKLVGSINQPEGYYYQGAYADVMRVIDFVNSRKDLDSKHIALVSTSQGGGISLAVAAIDDRVKTVVAHLPFLCNFKMAAKTEGSLVKQILDKNGKNTEANLNVLAFFDPFYLASKITNPTLISAGGKDKTCPKETIQSVYNRIPTKKELKIYPELKHTSCLAFYKETWKWLDYHMAEDNDT